jgi:hypothetical protein
MVVDFILQKAEKGFCCSNYINSSGTTPKYQLRENFNYAVVKEKIAMGSYLASL